MNAFFPSPFVRLAIAKFALVPLALAQDPPAPAGGFTVERLENRDITWSDGFATKVDIYRPAVAPPATGWPGVLAIHGGGGNRKRPFIQVIGDSLAAAGYVVYAYDVRGDGVTRALNPGFVTAELSPRRIHDNAESHSAVAGLVPGYVDVSRIAVCGESQGGQHAIQAAAYSGRALPTVSGPTALLNYPVVGAVMPEIAGLDVLGRQLPGGVLINDELVDDMDPTDPILVALAAGDYASVEAQLQVGLRPTIDALFQSSTVPTLMMLAWQDRKHQLNSAVDVFAGLSAARPHRLVLTSGGHGTPRNLHEDEVMKELRRRWFDRFLKGVQNGVELDRYAELGVEPDAPRYANVDSIWEHRQADQWPPATPLLSFYLRGNGTLRRNPPAAAEPGPAIQHRIAQPGYDLQAYVAERASLRLARLSSKIPKESRIFDSAPLPRTGEVFGRTTVDFEIDDTTGVVQLSVELAHVDPAGTEHFIAFGTGGRRDGVAGRAALQFDLGDAAHVVPAGHLLRVTVMNLAHHEPPGSERVRFVPYFSETTTRLLFEPAASCAVHVPLRDYEPNLRPRLGTASAAAGIDHRMQVQAGPEHANGLYALFLGASGEAPGLALPGFPHLPLQVDDWLAISAIGAGSPLFPGFVGRLNAQGNSPASIRIPAGADANSLIGLRFTVAGYLVDANMTRIEGALGPATLRIDP